MKRMGFIALTVVLFTASFAIAKKRRPPKAYSFIVEAGKASQAECDGEGKIPRGLKKQKDISKSGSYMGSERMEPFIQPKNNEEMWKHFFRDKPTCNSVLAKTPSSRGLSPTEKKPELPPDDSVEVDEDETESATPESE